MADSPSTGAFGTPADGYPSQSPTGSGINSPELSAKTLKSKRRAISDVNHVMRIVGDLQMARRSQNEKNGRIQGKLNSERPYDEKKLESEGLGYKSNFSTKPLSTTVGKVASRLAKSLQSARYLTSAELPDSFPGAKTKTELFRAKFTDTVRRWPGFTDFVDSVASEDAVFGWAVVAMLDEYTWKPTFFRQDQTFLPDGTKQTVESFQVGVFQQYIMPHELANLIGDDKEAAELAGWQIDASVRSINNAVPPAIPSSQAAPFTDTRRFEDAIRESSVSLSLTSGAKQIVMFHLFAVELDGRVSHYIADGNSRELMFMKEDRFETISDCVQFMSYEKAETLMGSKGIGREVYEMSGTLDRARNEAVDRLQLSGKVFVTGPENRINRFKLHVIGNVAVIPEGFNIQQVKIESGVQEFLLLEKLLVGLLDQIAGGVTPKDFERERVTAKEVMLFAEREEEKRDTISGRFVTQFGAILSMMQRRMCSKEASDEEAKRFREDCLRHMSEDELDFLASRPALRTIEDFTMIEAQKIVMFADSKRQDPLYNQKELQRRATSALINAEFAEAVLAQENDPTETAEQARLQLMENGLLEQGKPVPVSQRDGHEIHIEVLKQWLAPIAQQAATQPTMESVTVLSGAAQHWADHVSGLVQSGADKQVAAAAEQEVTQFAQQVGQMQAEVQQQEAQKAQLQQALATDPGAAGQILAQAQQPQQQAV